MDIFFLASWTHKSDNRLAVSSEAKQSNSTRGNSSTSCICKVTQSNGDDKNQFSSVFVH
jgi:hypothetical protein